MPVSVSCAARCHTVSGVLIALIHHPHKCQENKLRGAASAFVDLFSRSFLIEQLLLRCLFDRRDGTKGLFVVSVPIIVFRSFKPWSW